MYYLSMVCFVILLIIAKYGITKYSSSHTQKHTTTDFFVDEWLITDDHRKILNKYPLFRTSQIFLDSYSFDTNDEHASIFAIDCILLHSMIILYIWESLLLFYRYYSTMHVVKHFECVETYTVLKYFVVYYCVPFYSLCLVQLHVYYWMFPIVVAFYAFCNLFFSFKVVAILVLQQAQAMGIFIHDVYIYFDMLCFYSFGVCTDVFNIFYLYVIFVCV